MTMTPSDPQLLGIHTRPAIDASTYAVFDRVPGAVFVLELIDRHEPHAFRCSYANPAFRSLVGVGNNQPGPEECLPSTSVMLTWKYLETAVATRAAVTFQDRLTYPGRVLELVVDPIFDRDDRVVHFVGSATDVTEAVGLAAQLDFAQKHDSLTGLANRTTLHHRLSEAINHISVFDTTVALVLIDLDEFSVVNDSLGHTAGDEVIVTLARRIEGVLRFGDLVARLGGDEFAVMCNDVESAAAVEVMAERILETIAEPIVIDGIELVLHASAGMVIARDEHDEPQRLLRDADVALLAAKRHGRNQVAAFDSAMRTQAVARLDLEQDLHRAVRDDEFRVVYQPLVELATGEVAGFEALVRWEHPTRGLLLPMDFIPLAERTGLIVNIGEWVISEVCQQAARWRRDGDGLQPLVTSINLSARQLGHPDLVGTVAGAIAQAGISSSSIELEITESVLMDDPVLATTILHALRALGVRLSVDDFGTGHSSLGYLKQLPVHALKIDKSFVDGLGVDPNDSAIVAAIVSMGHALGLSVTGEGIETLQQRQVLESLGCDLGQGFYFAKPQPAAIAGALVSRRLRWVHHSQLKAA